MTQPGRYCERKRSYSILRHSEVPDLALMHHPGLTESDVVRSSGNDAEAHAGEASGLPFSTM
jgi:hypothetical protein